MLIVVLAGTALLNRLASGVRGISYWLEEVAHGSLHFLNFLVSVFGFVAIKVPERVMRALGY